MKFADGKKVVIVQTVLSHYRLPFFDRLREWLACRNTTLELLHGLDDPAELGRGDSVTTEWARVIETWPFRVGREEFIVQAIGPHLRGADLVIVPQENRLLHNYWLPFWSRLHGASFAFWGHGRNFQQRDGRTEHLRRLLIRLADWWFAYTELSAEAVRAAGYPDRRITVVNNAIDTENLIAHCRSITPEELIEARKRYGIRDSEKELGIFISSLYPGKRIDFVLEAASKIREKNPQFGLLIAGDGPCREMVRTFCEKNPWARWLGICRDREKALCLRLSDAMLLPYSVGLSILDAFCAGLPLIAVENANHGPEIAYLTHEENGLFTQASIEAYSGAVVDLLQDKAKQAVLRKNASSCADFYSLESMVERFGQGILQAMSQSKKWNW